jgi:hypothetical protein
MHRLLKYLPVILPLVLKVARDPRVKQFAREQLAKRRGGGAGGTGAAPRP